MKIPIYQVDAFTDKPFTGNPAAVCIINDQLNDMLMQSIAAEMNLSETAFVLLKKEYINLRWFTPITEVKLCGHATLAASHILWETNIIPQSKEIVFSTKSGIIKAYKNNNIIKLILPSIKVFKCQPPQEILKALNIKPAFIGKAQHDYVFLLENERNVINVKPDFELLKKLSKNGVIITSPSATASFDYVCRYFVPSQGINEDPATGSIQCIIAPLWAKILRKKSLICKQLSKREGIIYIETDKNNVIIGGYALTVLEGYFTIPSYINLINMI